MRKWLFALLILLLPALAQGEMVSIAGLQAQAQELGRWTATYEAHGRTIEVDIPIIVPDVQQCPIVAVEGQTPQATGALRGLVPKSGRKPEDDRLCVYTLTGEEEGAQGRAGSTVTFFDPDEGIAMLYMEYNVAQDVDASQTAQAYARRFPWQLDEQTAYAEDNPTTYGEALRCAQALGEWLYAGEGCGVSVESVTIWDRRRPYKGSSLTPTGAPVEGSPRGGEPARLVRACLPADAVRNPDRGQGKGRPQRRVLPAPG